MIIHILDKSYLVLYTIKNGDRELEQHICRDVNEKSDRVYRAVKIPADKVSGELVRYLMEQVHKKSFREFVDYVTDADGLTVFVDCGQGRSLNEICSQENLRLAERLEIARKLAEHLVLSDFPAYFVYAAMDPSRVKINDAMDFYFDFELAGLLDYERVDFSAACQKIRDVLKFLFQAELSRRAFPDMENLLYKLGHGGFSDLLSLYESLEAVCREWMEKDETKLESQSFAFLLWEKVKGLGRFLKTFVKVGVILLAVGYLALSVYEFVQPEPVAQVYSKIGNLEIRK